MVKKAVQAIPNQLLRRARLERGWTQKIVADRIGAPNDVMVTRWERGMAFPSPYYIERLCQLFDQPAHNLGLLKESPSFESPSSTPEQSNSTVQRGQQTDLASVPAVAVLLDPAIPQISRNRERILGREGLVQQLKQLLAESNGETTIALHGLPGVGKTTLAALLASDFSVQDSFPDGILWAGLGPTPNLQAILLRWAALLGVFIPQEGQDIKQETLIQDLYLSIGHRRMLLVIDDAWSEEDALALQLGGSRCVHLLTTRLPQVAFTFARQERLLIPELDAQMGVELLARYVPSLVKEHPQEVGELVGAVGGLPLALTLLGYYLAAQAFSGQPRRLQTALARLREGEQRLQISMPAARNECSSALSSQTPLSLYTTIALSTQMLDAKAFGAFCALSVFPAKPASFSEEAALSVAQCELATLDMLWDRGLLESSEPGRYMLHQTIREYGQQQQLGDEGQRRFVSYMVGYIHAHQHEYAVLEQELSTIQEAWERAYTLGMNWELLVGLHEWMPFVKARGYQRMAEPYLWYGWEAASTQVDAREQAIVSNHLADTLRLLGKFAQAKELAERGLALTDALDEKQVRASLLLILGRIANDEGDGGQAEAYYQEGLELARHTQDTLLICRLASHYGPVLVDRGQPMQGRSYFEEALQLARKHQYLRELSDVLCRLGVWWGRQGNVTEAERYYLEALPIAQRLGQRVALCYLLNNLGDIAFNRGAFTQAVAYCQQGLELARQIQHPFALTTLLTTQGECFLAQRKYVQAQQVLQEVVTLARESQLAQRLSYALCYLGKAIGYVEGYERARGLFEEGLALARQLSMPFILYRLLAGWGEIELFHGHFDDARKHFQEVVTFDGGEQHDPKMLAQAHYGMAQIALHEQDMSKAREHAAASVKLFNKIGSYKAQEVEAWAQTLAEKRVQSPKRK